ncbi:MAG: hypothetical protein PHI06_00810 [Desulfobulbaceae bacterium]|nr:hypothetical protein [Desulfobulbaceae bacterium]
MHYLQFFLIEYSWFYQDERKQHTAPRPATLKLAPLVPLGWRHYMDDFLEIKGWAIFFCGDGGKILAGVQRGGDMVDGRLSETTALPPGNMGALRRRGD